MLLKVTSDQTAKFKNLIIRKMKKYNLSEVEKKNEVTFEN